MTTRATGRGRVGLSGVSRGEGMDTLGMEKDFFQRHLGILGELWAFMRVRKKFWLLLALVMLLLAGALIVFGQSTGLSPLIYMLF